MRRLAWTSLWLTMGSLFLYACPRFAGALCDDGRCDALGDGGGDGPTIAGCDPSQNAACVDESAGYFVNGTSGNDAATGTRAAPLATIGAALAKVTTDKPRVYICAGTYRENLAVTKPTGLYGGLDCATWVLVPGQTSNVVGQPPTTGSVAYALDIVTPGGDVTVQDMSFDTYDHATSDSITTRVVRADNVTFRRLHITSKTAADGPKGADGVMGAMGTTGNGAVSTTAAAAQPLTCSGGNFTNGGNGGGINSNGAAGSPRISSEDGGFVAGGAAGDTSAASCNAGGNGQDGASARTAADGQPAQALGVASANEWKPAAGTLGVSGGVGQGGGGGAGKLGGGGGGGAGGCGGTGGGPGGGGGGSIALLALDSTIDVSSSTFRTSAAGKGGGGVAGASGGAGGPGGPGGSGITIPLPGCSGGQGGNGGKGGAGAGGNGGLSACVVYTLRRPTLTDSPCTLGQPGAGGTGGNPGHNDGLVGQAVDVYEAQAQ